MNPLVSVCILTYNQKAYISECLDGVLSQKCDFEFEILIHDDASSDGTADIIRSYAEKYPEIIKPIYETENKFSKSEIKNISGIYNFPRASGKYIAMCEGDDYWCDDGKLATQTAYMEAHPECTLCFHSAIQIRGDVICSDRMMRPYSSGRTVTPEEIINKKGAYPTASLLMKAEVMKKLPEFYMKAPIGDIPMQLCMTAEGYGYYIDKPMCAYRYCIPGSWTSDMLRGDYTAKQKKYADEMSLMYERFDDYTDHRFHDSVTEAKGRLVYRTHVNIRDWDTVFAPENRKYLDELGVFEKCALRFEKSLPGAYNGLKKLFSH